MSDIATLGLKIDSSQTKAAVAALTELAAISKPAAQSVSEFEKTASKARDTLATTTKGVSGLGTALGTGIQKPAVAATASLGLARHELINLSRQAQDVGVSLASGQSPLMVLVQQGAQIGDIFATTKGSVSGVFRQVIGGISPVMALGVGLTAAAAGAYLFYSSIKTTELQFGALSERVNATVKDLHEFETVAAFKGIETSDFLKSMERFGTLTTEALHNTGSLNALFRANGVAVGTTTENLYRAADLIKNAKDEAEKYRLIQQLGLPATREWVQYLSMGSAGIRKAREESVKFGAANADLIRNAREFDEAWNRAWKNFENGAKSGFVTAYNGLNDVAGVMNTSAGKMLFTLLTRGPAGVIADAVVGEGVKRLTAVTAKPKSGRTVPAADQELRDRLAGGSTKNPEDIVAALAREQPRIGLIGVLLPVKKTREASPEPRDTPKEGTANDRDYYRSAA